MGRHSAPDENEDVLPDAGQTADVLVAEAPLGRHAAALDATADTTVEDDAGQAAEVLAQADTEVLPEALARADTAVLPGAGERAEQPEVASRPQPKRAPNADLRMLRESPALRARCAAAVVVPFVLFTIVLLVIGRTDVYLLWVWIPTVSAGVLAGSLLDLAARKRNVADEHESPDDPA